MIVAAIQFALLSSSSGLLAEQQEPSCPVRELDRHHSHVDECPIPKTGLAAHRAYQPPKIGMWKVVPDCTAQLKLAEVSNLDDKLTVFFTGTKEPKELVERNRHHVPNGTEFRYYNDAQQQQAAAYVSQNLEQFGVKGAFKAYNSLRPMAFRADLWRYMMVWEYGGIYIDAKLVFMHDVTSWARPELSPALFADTEYAGTHYQGAIYAERRDPVLLAAIRRVIANVETHYYGNCSLDPTGPAAVTDAWKASDTGKPVRSVGAFRTIRHAGQDTGLGLRQKYGFDAGLYLWESNRLAVGASGKWHGKQRGCRTCNWYWQVYYDKAVYCDEPYEGLEFDPCKEQTRRNLRLVAGGRRVREPAYWSMVV